jgi:hypothetical protein
MTSYCGWASEIHQLIDGKHPTILLVQDFAGPSTVLIIGMDQQKTTSNQLWKGNCVSKKMSRQWSQTAVVNLG